VKTPNVSSGNLLTKYEFIASHLMHIRNYLTENWINETVNMNNHIG